MKRSNFGMGSAQRPNILKPKNSCNSSSRRQNSGQQAKKIRSSADGNPRLSQLFARLTPVRSNIPRCTPLRSNVPSSNTLAPPYSANRQSMDQGRNSSIGGKNRKDTRPVGDVGFKSECIEKILDYLSCSGCHFQVDRRMLLNPQTKMFIDIFNFLYGHFEYNYKLPKKFEEEIPRLLKLMKYPTQISKSSFIPVGSPHTWPSVLAMMAWLIDSIGVYTTSSSFVQTYSSDFDLVSSITEKRFDKLLELFHCENHPDVLEEHYMDYAHSVDLLYEVRPQDERRYQEDIRKLDEETDLLSIESVRLSQFQSQFELLVSDRDTLLNHNEEFKVFVSSRDCDRVHLEAQLREVKIKLHRSNEEVLQLKKVKTEQGLSAMQLAEFKEHAKDVANLIHQLQPHGKEIDSQIWSLEMSLSKSQKDLSEKTNAYNEAISQLDLSEDMEIDCGNISENIQQWKIIRMELNEYKKNSKQEMYDVQKTKMIKEEEQSLAQEWLNEDKLATDNLEIKLRRTEETISLMNTESTREVKELELEAESLHQQIMEAKKKDNVSLHHLQNSLEETKSNLESTKAYGKNRMRSGYELLVKVCHSSVDDLDTGMELVVNMKHCVQKCCDGLLEVAKAATANALRINISQTYQL